MWSAGDQHDLSHGWQHCTPSSIVCVSITDLLGAQVRHASQPTQWPAGGPGQTCIPVIIWRHVIFGQDKRSLYAHTIHDLATHHSGTPNEHSIWNERLGVCFVLLSAVLCSSGLRWITRNISSLAHGLNAKARSRFKFRQSDRENDFFSENTMRETK